MNKILVDTNVLVYSIDQESRYFDKSSELLNSKNEIFISSKSLSEFFAVVTRAPFSPLSASDSLKLIQWFSNNFTILFPDMASLNILFYTHSRKCLGLSPLPKPFVGEDLGEGSLPLN